MTSTVFGSFSNPTQAQQAAGELLASGIKPEELSIVMGSAASPPAGTRNAPPDFETDVPLGHSVPITFSGTNGTGNRLDPFDNSMHEVATRYEGDAENNANLDSVLNPAQDDYPRTGSDSPTEFSSAPPSAERDYNPGLETDDYAKGYSAGADREIERDEATDRRRGATNATTPEDSTDAMRARFQVGEPRRDAIHNAPLTSTDERLWGDTAGALMGTEIPGVGMIAGGGPLATSVQASRSIQTQLAASGLPEDRARTYADQVSNGGAIVAVSVVEDVAPTQILDTLRKHGATRAETTSSVAT